MNILSQRSFWISSFILVGVLVTSALLLQRISFRAEEQPASLALSPATFRLAVGEPVDITLTSTATNPVSLAGVQVHLRYQPEKVEFREVTPPVGWRNLKVATHDGVLEWALAPGEAQPPGVTINGQTDLGVVRFVAVGSGVAALTLNREKTILAAVDSTSGQTTYNAIESLQNSAGTITAQAEGELTFPEIGTVPSAAIPVVDSPPLFGSQRVIGSEVVTGTRDGVLFVTLAYPGRATVEFNTGTEVLNRVETTEIAATHIITLTGLTPKTTYSYTIIGEQTGEYSRIVTPKRSFTTPSVGSGLVSPKASAVIMFPTRTKSSSTLFVFPRNEAGEALSEASVTVTGTGVYTLGEPVKLTDSFRIPVNTALSTKQIVRLTPSVDSVALESRSVMFDPAYVEPTAPNRKELTEIKWGGRTVGTVLIGLLLAFFSIFGFIKLAHLR